METINQVIQTIDLEQPQPQRRNYEHVSDPVLDRFWLRMTEMYGGMWTNAQGDEPNETWWLGLRDLKPEQIKKGIESLRDSAKPFPPSLPEFRGLCKGSGGVESWEAICHKPFQPDRALEDKGAQERARVAGEKALLEMRGLFDGLRKDRSGDGG